MDLEKNLRTQNPKEYFSKRSQTLGELNMELSLLKIRINSESEKYSNKIFYSFSPSVALFFLSPKDVLAYKNGGEINCGLYQISTINVVYRENSKDNDTKLQLIELKFFCSVLEADKEEDGSHKIVVADYFQPSFPINKIIFDDVNWEIKDDIHQRILFLDQSKYDEVKDFIESVKKELK